MLRPVSTFLPLALAASAFPAQAQTATTYPAPTGSVSSTLTTVMNLTPGGTANLTPVVGPDCYFGQVCGFPAGYVGTFMSYTLPDGTSARLTDFHGIFEPWRNDYRIMGAASGTDSAGHHVRVFERVTMTISCRSGRGGGCTKTYVEGALRVAVE